MEPGGTFESHYSPGPPFPPRPNWDTIFGMHRCWHLFLCLALTLPCGAQTRTRQNLASILGFENGTPGAFPAGWSGGPADTIVIHDKVVHGGDKMQEKPPRLHAHT